MKVTIIDKDLEELIFTGHNNRLRKYERNKSFMDALGRVYRIMETVQNAQGLKPYSFLHYERLKNNADVSSVRVMNGRIERLVFRELEEGIVIELLELNSDHYGKEK